MNSRTRIRWRPVHRAGIAVLLSVAVAVAVMSVAGVGRTRHAAETVAEPVRSFQTKNNAKN